MNTLDLIWINVMNAEKLRMFCMNHCKDYISKFSVHPQILNMETNLILKCNALKPIKEIKKKITALSFIK